MFTFFLACIFLAGSALSSTPALSNNFMDGVLGNELKNAVRFKSLDPKNLPDFQTNFTAKIVLSHSNVQTDYSWGKLHGLSVVKRSQTCSAPKWVTSSSFGNATLNCTLTFPQLRVEYSAWVKSPISKLTVLANVTNVQFQVELIGRRAQVFPSLKDFRVINWGNIQPRFAGLSAQLEQVALGNFTYTFTNKVSGPVYQILSNEFKNTFADAVKQARNMPMPK